MDRKEKLKIILITGLSILTAGLIYFYISGNINSDININTVDKIKSVSPDRLNQETDSILFTFGIKKEWIKNISSKDNEQKNSDKDQLITKEILLPNEFPVIDLNFEITNYLKSRYLENKVYEDPRTKNLIMNIYNLNDSNKKQSGLLKFIYRDSLKRNSSDVCIVLDSIDANSLSGAETILNSSQEFSVFLPLRNDKAEYQSIITDLEKDYLIKFVIGNEEDITADFSDNMKESQWVSKVKSVSLSFAKSAGIILYNNGASSDFYNKIYSEFADKNVKVYRDTIFTDFKQNVNKVMSLISNIISENSRGKKFLIYNIYFSKEEFVEFEKNILALKKSGYRFFNFRDLMIRKNKIHN